LQIFSLLHAQRLSSIEQNVKVWFKKTTVSIQFCSLWWPIRTE